MGLQAVAQVRQQACYGLVTDLVSPADQGVAEIACTLTGPPQRRHGIAPGGSINELFQVVEQEGILLGTSWPAPTLASDAILVRCGLVMVRRWRLDVADASVDGRTRQSRGGGHQGDSAASERAGLTRRPKAACLFMKQWSQHLLLVSDLVDQRRLLHKGSVGILR